MTSDIRGILNKRVVTRRKSPKRKLKNSPKDFYEIGFIAKGRNKKYDSEEFIAYSSAMPHMVTIELNTENTQYNMYYTEDY